MKAPVDLGAELLGVIARLGRWATQQADLDIPPAQARLLAQIDALGRARIGDLARADHCSQPTMTTQVQRLLESGWVTREADPSDARAVLVALSRDGQRVLAEVRRAREQAVAPLLARVGDDERERVREAVETLARLLAAAGTHSDENEESS